MTWYEYKRRKKEHGESRIENGGYPCKFNRWKRCLRIQRDRLDEYRTYYTTLKKFSLCPFNLLQTACVYTKRRA